jgi:copper transport protein
LRGGGNGIGGIIKKIVVFAAVIAALALPSVAWAHASETGSTPAEGQIVQVSPPRVVVRFTEPVEAKFGSIRVFNDAARQVDTGDLQRPSARSVAVRLKPKLPRGTYTVTWHVVSADAHPIGDSFVFHVGAPGKRPEGIAGELKGQGGAPTEVVMLGDGVRAAQFALLLLCVGGAFALLWPLAAAEPLVRRRLYAALSGSAYALAAVAGFGIVVQGALAGGVGLAAATRWSFVSAVLETRYGQAWLLCGAGALLLSALAAATLVESSRTVEIGTFVLAALCAITPSLVGHAHVSGSLATFADIVHVEAAALWTGGLAAVAAALMLQRGSRWRLAATAVPRFSRSAVLSVAVLIAAGTISGYLEVRQFRALWETSYGQLLLAKLALVTPLLVLGAWNNRFAVPRLRSELASVLERRRFVQRAGVELGLMVTIIAVTGALVAQPPARASLVHLGPVSADTVIGPYKANIVVNPATTGANTINVYLLDRNGRRVTPAAVETAASLPSENIAPLRSVARPLAPGRFAVREAQFPLPGEWTLRVSVRRGEFDLFEKKITIQVRKAQ